MKNIESVIEINRNKMHCQEKQRQSRESETYLLTRLKTCHENHCCTHHHHPPTLTRPCCYLPFLSFRPPPTPPPLLPNSPLPPKTPLSLDLLTSYFPPYPSFLTPPCCSLPSPPTPVSLDRVIIVTSPGWF